ncbi:MAG: serine/threonine protein kinase, partial [Ktedonobacteraceae bacterium]|nr:serine/threonine protein kinase [Ktedonobacteraceae bacterium]
MGEPSSPVQLSGLILGNYRLEQPVEQHPWGPAFLARDKKGMAYLVRFIDLPLYEWAASERSERAIFLGRLQQEANRVALLRHPHILPLLDYGNHRGIPYLVYPYAQFPSLRSLLKRPVSSDLVSIGRYLDQIASALAYAHERAVLHRNLSTRCIFLQSPQHLMVADFGLMYMHQIGKQLAEIAHGKQQGPVYDGSSESSAPESLLNRPPEVATDVYALGAVLYRMLTGYPPFNGKTPEMVAQQHLSAQVPPLATWRPGLPAELDQVIGRALAKEPSARFQSPMALAEAYYQAVALGERPTRSYTMPGPLVPATSDPLGPGEPVQHAAQETGSGQKVSRRSFVVAGLGASAVAVIAAAV